MHPMDDEITPCCGYDMHKMHSTIGTGADGKLHRKGCENGPRSKPQPTTEQQHMTNKTEFVKLEAAIQLTPRDYRVLLAQLAVQYVAKAQEPQLFVDIARQLLTACGIEEAKVPAQHQQQLSDEAKR